MLDLHRLIIFDSELKTTFGEGEITTKKGLNTSMTTVEAANWNNVKTVSRAAMSVEWVSEYVTIIIVFISGMFQGNDWRI